MPSREPSCCLTEASSRSSSRRSRPPDPTHSRTPPTKEQLYRAQEIPSRPVEIGDGTPLRSFATADLSFLGPLIRDSVMLGMHHLCMTLVRRRQLQGGYGALEHRSWG